MATATAIDLRAGKKTERLEAAIEVGLDLAITEKARELAGLNGNPRQFRSEAARQLLAKGILTERQERARAARRA